MIPVQHLTCILLIFVIQTAAGLSVIPGSQTKVQQSFLLEDHNRRAFQLSEANAEKLARMISRKNFSLLITLKQKPQTDGTLLAVYSRPDSRVLDIFVDGKYKTLRLSFRVQTGILDSMTGDVDLSDGKWHKIILEMAGPSVKLFVDCQPLLEGSFPEIDFAEITASYAKPKIWVGQLDRRLSYFIGSLKEFSANSGSMSKQVCRNNTQTVDTVTRDSISADSAVSYLNHRVRYLENEFKRWREVVEQHERQLQKVHLHQRGCKVILIDRWFESAFTEYSIENFQMENVDVYLKDGEKWRNETSCTECHCSRGATHCKPVGCRQLSCTDPLLEPDQCCPTCGKKCFYMGKYYEHGHVSWPKKCVKCSCNDGKMSCTYEKSECPALSCPRDKQRVVGNQCCPVCVDLDFCSSNPCHVNATCSNGVHEARCTCQSGFFGNGFSCYDIDECLWTSAIAEQLGGCGRGTRCINTPGSYRCECLPGYMKFGSSNTCIDVVLI